MQLADKIVFVGLFLKRVERVGEGREERFTNVYVKNLAESVDDDGLRKMCEEHGPVTSAVVMTVGLEGLVWRGLGAGISTFVNAPCRPAPSSTSRLEAAPSPAVNPAPDAHTPSPALAPAGRQRQVAGLRLRQLRDGRGGRVGGRGAQRERDRRQGHVCGARPEKGGARGAAARQV